ncbi:MAG: sporulation protein Cse60 [Anaeroplasmataceae bacterium]|nr:sporulation protein Cse60 [Anaeroplasmataceae bacterium]
MKAKLFDFEHEKDLEDALNNFFSENPKIEIKNILYQTSHFAINSEQIYSFSCLLLYK